MAFLRILTLITFGLLTFAGSYYLVNKENIATVIPEQVYRSAQLDAQRLKEIIQQYKIQTVLNLRGAKPGKNWYEEERAMTTQLGTKHIDIRFSAAGLPPYRNILQLIRTLDTATAPLLIHCRGGADRTGMGSVITLLLEGKQSIAEIGEQLSLKYLVVWPDSVGILLLEQYSNWLDHSNTRHTPDLFRKWLTTDYVDADGNLLYYIDQINREMWQSGTRYEDGYDYIVNRNNMKDLEISGWAVDVKGGQPVKQVDIHLGEQYIGTADYGYAYTNVASYLNEDRFTDSGWMLRAPIKDLAAGCYDLTLDIVRLDNSTWRSKPQARVCLE